MLGTVVLLNADAAEARRYASIVIDASNGQVLHADNPDRKAYPASLTKIMTLYMVFEALESGKLTMNSKLKVSKRAARMPPSKLGLRSGQTIKVRDAVMALVTKSANDVAVVVAEAIGGTESNFARMMTREARSIGMSRTTFRNASGLPNTKQLSTARDMSKLARVVMRKFPKYYTLFSTTTFTYKGRKYGNHNKLLKGFWGTDGIKTGYTHASGFNLVASTMRNNRRLIGVVFGGKTGRSRDKHMKKLLANAFKKAGKRSIPALVSAPARKPWGDGLATLVAEAQGLETQQVADSKAAEKRAAEQKATEAKAAEAAEARAKTNSLAAASLAAAMQATTPEPTRQTAAGERPTASLPSLHALVAAPQAAAEATPEATPEVELARNSDPIGEQIASLPGVPDYAEIPKRPAFDSLVASPGSGVRPPAYAAIPQRPDHMTAQGSGDSPVPIPPQYGAIPKRPDLAATNDSAPQATQTAGTSKSLGSFKLLKPKQTASSRSAHWGVQVGAFRRLPLAELTASEVARAAPHQLNGLDMEISQAATGSGDIYRARFTGTNEDRARQVCEHLKAKNISCVVVPPASNEG